MRLLVSRALRFGPAALGLALALDAEAGTRLKSPRTDPAFEGLKRGGVSEVYKHVREPLIVKLIMSRALPRDRWVTYPAWLERSNGRIGLREKKLLTSDVMRAYRALRADRSFQGRFGHLLPETASPKPGRIDQAFVEGVDFDELSPRAQRRATAEMGHVLAAAKRVLVGQRVDHGVYNFKFDQHGHVRGWFDWVMPDLPVAGRL